MLLYGKAVLALCLIPVARVTCHPTEPAVDVDEKDTVRPSYEYGPSFPPALNHADGRTFNFDDTQYMWSHGVARSLSRVDCYHQNPGNHFNGIKGFYSDADGHVVGSTYRGYYNPWSVQERINRYGLGMSEEWTEVQYIYCNRRVQAISFRSSRDHSVSCGNWKPWKGCISGSLKAANGRKIVGLWGLSGNRVQQHPNGILGIGLITLPSA